MAQIIKRMQPRKLWGSLVEAWSHHVGLTTRAGARKAGRNAFELGRDYERGLAAGGKRVEIVDPSWLADGHDWMALEDPHTRTVTIVATSEEAAEAGRAAVEACQDLGDAQGSRLPGPLSGGIPETVAAQ